MKKLALITLSTALFFTLPEIAEGTNTKCVECPTLPSDSFQTYCKGSGEGTFSCVGISSDANWILYAHNVPAPAISCNQAGESCYINSIRLVQLTPSPTGGGQYKAECLYSIGGTDFFSGKTDELIHVVYKDVCSFSSEHALDSEEPTCDCESGFCCPDSSN